MPYGIFDSRATLITKCFTVHDCSVRPDPSETQLLRLEKKTNRRIGSKMVVHVLNGLFLKEKWSHVWFTKRKEPQGFSAAVQLSLNT